MKDATTQGDIHHEKQLQNTSSKRSRKSPLVSSLRAVQIHARWLWLERELR
jgi:hypothetical protein